MAKIERKVKKTSGLGEVKKALMSGISYIIPLVVAGGMILSLALVFGQEGSILGYARTDGTIAFKMRMFGGSILGLMVPMLAAYIAFGLEGKVALVPGLAGGLAANSIGSGFLGGMVAGLIAGYIVRYIKKIKINESFAGTMNIFIIPLFASFIIGVLMIFIIGKPIAALNTGLVNGLDSIGNSNPILLGLIIGAMACFDMGGPLNKAAYAFSLAAIEAGNGIPYAAFSAAKSLPGIAITISVLLFSKYYNEEERESAKSSWILGLAGITEGAIPFAIADPLRVIPSMMFGGAVAAAISIAGSSSLLAAGGSILTIPVTTNAVNWVVALIAGTLAAAAMLSILKKIKFSKEA